MDENFHKNVYHYRSYGILVLRKKSDKNSYLNSQPDFNRHPEASVSFPAAKLRPQAEVGWNVAVVEGQSLGQVEIVAQLFAAWNRQARPQLKQPRKLQGTATLPLQSSSAPCFRSSSSSWSAGLKAERWCPLWKFVRIKSSFQKRLTYVFAWTFVYLLEEATRNFLSRTNVRFVSVGYYVRANHIRFLSSKQWSL